MFRFPLMLTLSLFKRTDIAAAGPDKVVENDLMNSILLVQYVARPIRKPK